MRTKTPFELIPPGNPAFSTKERFAEMCEEGTRVWIQENRIENGPEIELIPRKAKPVKTRFKSNLYR